MDFYFNSANITKPIEGTVTSGTFTTSDATTHPGVLLDNDLRLSTNFAGSTLKGVRFSAESWSPINVFDITDNVFDISDNVFEIGTSGSGSATHLIVCQKDTDAPSVEVWSSDDSMTGYTKVFDDTIEANSISINAITNSTAKYFVVQFKNTYNIDVTEILLAEGVTDVYNYDNISKKTIDTLSKSSDYNGSKVTNELDDIKYQISLTWDVQPQAQTNKLKSLNDGVDGIHKSFIMVKDGVRTWNTLTQPPVFTEVALNYDSTQLNFLRSFV